MTQPSLLDVPVRDSGMANTPVQQELKRIGKAGERVLARLRLGPATNVELNAICFRYGARLFDAKQRGAVIEKSHVGDGVYAYALTKDLDS